MRWLPSRVHLALFRRRVMGREKYGTALRVGWTSADDALLQELLDGVEYAVSGQRKFLALFLGAAAWWVLRSCDQKNAQRRAKSWL